MNRWIRYGGHYSSYYAPLFKKGYGRCENRLYDQHFIITGAVKLLKQPVIDIISDSLTRFTERHNRWATLEAQEILCAKKDNIKLKSSFLGNKMQQKRKLKDIYYKMPLFLRAFLYYFYRYIIKLGFLDGYEGLIFHFLQGFWFRFLVDAKIFELKRQQKHTLPT